MKFLTLLWVVFLPSVLFIILDNFYANRSIDLTKNWLKLDTEYTDMSHMASSLARYQRLILSSDFIKGVRIHDSSLKIVSHFGDVNDNFSPAFPANNGVKFTRAGFFNYRTTFIVSTFDQKYLVTFFFDSKVGKISFVVLALGLLILSLCFMGLSTRRSKKENDQRIATVVRAIESYAHDIGNTLNWTKKLVEAIQEQDIERFENLSKYVDRTLRFANGLRLEMLSLSNPVLTDVKTLDIRNIYLQCRDILVSDISKVNISESFKHTLLVQADEIKISRIVINLLQNSYRHARTFISISTRNHEKGIYFEITNDGECVPKSILKDVFKPFVSTKGSGLGLYICKIFVELHGGSIEISSQHEITKVKIWLPGVQVKECKSKVQRAKNSSLTVALIDDESYHLEEVSKKFQDSTIQLVAFTNIDDFYLSLIENNYYDIVVVDRFGPGFDSVEDKFPKIVRDEFGFNGKLVLYSNSVVEAQSSFGFDFALSKEHVLNPDMIKEIASSTSIA